MNLTCIKVMVVLLLVLNSGCSFFKNLGQSEIGQPISSVMDRWGSPSRMSSDGKGGKIYVWEHWIPNPEGGGHMWSNTYWADSDGIVYRWR
jgi:hypothetical protein